MLAFRIAVKRGFNAVSPEAWSTGNRVGWQTDTLEAGFDRPLDLIVRWLCSMF
jgi:hypothetical protein